MILVAGSGRRSNRQRLIDSASHIETHYILINSIYLYALFTRCDGTVKVVIVVADLINVHNHQLRTMPSTTSGTLPMLFEHHSGARFQQHRALAKLVT